MLALPAVISFKPSTNEGQRSNTAATLQVPGIFVRLSANGPITAMLPFGLKGSKGSGATPGRPGTGSFFKSTKLSAAILRAASRCAFVKMSRAGRFGSQYLYGLSNNPNLYLASRIRLQAVFNVSIETLPS